jgi:ribosome-binding factor A
MGRREIYVQKRDSLLKRYLTNIVEYGLEELSLRDVFISEIEVNADGSVAWVYIDNEGTLEEKMEAVDILNANKSEIRLELVYLLNTKKVPKLNFKPDLSKESEDRIDQILADIPVLSEEEVKKEIKKSISLKTPEQKKSQKAQIKTSNQALKKQGSYHRERKTLSDSKNPSNKRFKGN